MAQPGERGESSYVPLRGGRALVVLGETARLKVAGADTGGAYGPPTEEQIGFVIAAAARYDFEIQGPPPEQ